MVEIKRLPAAFYLAAAGSLLCLCSGTHAESATAQSLEFMPAPLPTGDESPTPVPPPDAGISQETANEDPFARPHEEVLDAISRRLRLLAGELAAGGYRSKDLIEHLSALAALYQEVGDHYPAIGALDWALNISRINNGLFSLDHVALLEQMIESTTAVGDFGAAASFEERVIELAYRNWDDARVTVILAASADRQLRETHRLLEEGNTRHVAFVIGMQADPTAVGDLPSMRRNEALVPLWAARRRYAEAVAAAVGNGGYAVLDLLEYEDRMLSTFFLEMSHPELAPSPESKERLCASGEAVLTTSLENVSRFRESTLATANTMIRLADWRLLCARNGRALDTYESAYATLRDDPGAIANLLSPEVPAALPAFRDASSGGQEPQAYRGYVDISFVIGKYGTARAIEVLGRSTGTTNAIEKELRSYITRHRFRPRFVDGELARTDRVEARYYYR